MTFTDDDLKRLKEELIGHDPRIVTPLANEYPKLWSLLARLEAAENNMRGHVGICRRWYTNKIMDMKYLKTVCVCGKRETEKAWRKACGHDQD